LATPQKRNFESLIAFLERIGEERTGDFAAFVPNFASSFQKIWRFTG